MIAITIILILVQGAAFNQSTILTPEKVTGLIAGQEAIMNGQYEMAEIIFDDLFEDDPAGPLGYLMRATVMYSEMMDREENLCGDKFEVLCDSVVTAAEEKLNECTPFDSALCYLCLGHQFAYRSLREARFGSTLSAISLGLKTKGEYENGIRCDSTLYDLYLGLGSYHYWKSVKSGLLRKAGIFSDDRDQGIQEIELAADSALFSKDAARSALIWILIDDKQYDSAMAMCQAMLTKYPDGNSFYWPLAQACFESGKYDSAAVVYGKLFDLLKADPGNYYNIIEAVYFLTECYNELGREGDTDYALDYIEDNFSMIPSETKKRQKNKLRVITGNR